MILWISHFHWHCYNLLVFANYTPVAYTSLCEDDLSVTTLNTPAPATL